MHAIQDYLSDRSLTVRTLAGSLIIDCLGKAVYRLLAIVAACLEHEFCCSAVRPFDEWPFAILLCRFLGRKGPKQVGRREVERLGCAGSEDRSSGRGLRGQMRRRRPTKHICKGKQRDEHSPGGHPPPPPLSHDPAEIDRKYPRAFDQIALPQPPGIGCKSISPFQAKPLQLARSALLFARLRNSSPAPTHKAIPPAPSSSFASRAISSCCGEPTVRKVNRASAEAMKFAASRRAFGLSRRPIGGT